MKTTRVRQHKRRTRSGTTKVVKHNRVKKGTYFVYSKIWNDDDFQKKIIKEVGRKPDWGYGMGKFGYSNLTLIEAKKIGKIMRKINEDGKNGGMIFFGQEDRKGTEKMMQNIEEDYIFR